MLDRHGRHVYVYIRDHLGHITFNSEEEKEDNEMVMESGDVDGDDDENDSLDGY